jgi:hypothetical protein
MGEASELKAGCKSRRYQASAPSRLVSTGCFFGRLHGAGRHVDASGFGQVLRNAFRIVRALVDRFYSGGLPFVYRLLPSLNNVVDVQRPVHCCSRVGASGVAPCGSFILKPASP